EGALERTWVDRVEKITLLDELAVLEVDLVEITRNARADIDGFDGIKAPRVLVPFDDRLHDGLRCRDVRQLLTRSACAGAGGRYTGLRCSTRGLCRRRQCLCGRRTLRRQFL